jgi:hypothetical protein
MSNMPISKPAKALWLSGLPIRRLNLCHVRPVCYHLPKWRPVVRSWCV